MPESAAEFFSFEACSALDPLGNSCVLPSVVVDFFAILKYGFGIWEENGGSRVAKYSMASIEFIFEVSGQT